MITNHPDFLQRVILSMAEEAYQNEIVSTKMEELTVGKGLDWETKQDWISEFIIQHFNIIKEYLISSKKSWNPNETTIEKETFMMRLYSLDVCESFDIDNFTKVTRFPGGWVYENRERKTFIPYNDEFNSEDGILAKEFAKLNEMEDANAQ